MELKDTYRTIDGDFEALFKDRSSKFLTYAFHVESVEQIKEHLDALRKRYYDATHHCYAYRIGYRGEKFRMNDDGEPSSTAGKPILGQIISNDLTNILIVVVRYFGGTKLGVPGLINAYKESSAAVIEVSRVVELTIDAEFEVRFSYLAMNSVMKIIKDLQPRIISQEFDNLCTMRLASRESLADQLYDRLKDADGVEVDKIEIQDE